MGFSEAEQFYLFVFIIFFLLNCLVLGKNLNSVYLVYTYSQTSVRDIDMSEELRSTHQLIRACLAFSFSSFVTVGLLLLGCVVLFLGLAIFQMIFIGRWMLLTLPLTALFLPILFSTVILVRVHGMIVSDRSAEDHSWQIAQSKFWPIFFGRLLYAFCLISILGAPYALLQLSQVLFEVSDVVWGLVIFALLQMACVIWVIFLLIKFYFWRIIIIVDDSHLLAAFAKSYQITSGSWRMVFNVVILPYVLWFFLAVLLGFLQAMGAPIWLMSTLMLLYALLILQPWTFVTQSVLLDELRLRFEIYRKEKIAEKWKKKLKT